MSNEPRENPLPPEGINAPTDSGLGEFGRLLIGLLVVAVLITLAAVLAARWLAPLVPFSWERSVVASVRPDNVVADTEAQRALDRLSEELVAAADLPEGMKIEAHLVDSEPPNAFATLGGQVMVTRGLLDHVESENGLAMVVAHEIAHVRERHPIQVMSRGAVVSLVMTAITGATGQSAAQSVLGKAGVMTVLRFNRAMERAADRAAVEILRSHYGHTRGAGEFFRSLAGHDSAPAWTELMRTHPRNEERLKTLAAQQRKHDAELTPLPEAFADL